MLRRLLAAVAIALALIEIVGIRGGTIRAGPDTCPLASSCPTDGSRKASTVMAGPSGRVRSPTAPSGVATSRPVAGDVSPAWPARPPLASTTTRGLVRLWVAGATGPEVRVYGGRALRLLRTYAFPGAGFLNDVVVTRKAVYVTDSNVQQLIVIPTGRFGRLAPESAAFRCR